MAGASHRPPTDPTRRPTVVQDQTQPRAPGQPQGTTGATPGGPTPGAATAASKGPGIRIDPLPGVAKASDGNPLFSITAEPKMPVIEITARVVGIVTGADPTPTTEFEWTAEVSFDSKNCPSGVVKKQHKWHWGTYKVGETRTIPAITKAGKSTGGKITVKFDEIRGGTLTIAVKATVGGVVLKGETKGWRIQGTNPSRDVVGQALQDDTHRKIACVESSMEQFKRAKHEGDAWYPKFSEDALLGVGICQLTDPRPTDDQVWDWSANVEAGVNLYNNKREQAKKYPGQVARSGAYLALVRRYNEKLMKGTPPAAAGASTATPAAMASVNVAVPEFTDQQLE